MAEIVEGSKPARIGNRRDHMANERTFLAWIRTSVGVMAFGFVVEKFALFIRQLSSFLGNQALRNPTCFHSPGIFISFWRISRGAWRLDGRACIYQVQEGGARN